MLSHVDKLGHVTESTPADELRAENATMLIEIARLRKQLSRVEADRDLQHAYAVDLQLQLDRERLKNKGLQP
jgi:hypothetical protein